MMASPRKRRLGRGLDSLVTPEPKPVATQSHEEGGGSESILNISQIIKNPFQPRTVFRDDRLTELAESVRKHGVMQPILVRKLTEGRYELIAGERRLRASQIAGLVSIPAIVKDVDDRTSAEWALVENIQRADLNTVDRARGLARLRDEFGLTQAEIAETVGLERSSVSNLIRILELEPELLELIRNERLSLGHAKALLALAAGPDRVRLGEQAAAERWSVRRLEGFGSSGPPRGGVVDQADPRAAAHETHRRDLESKIAEQLGTRVRLTTRQGGKKGTLAIEFFDANHFEGLLQRLGVSLDH